MKYIYAVTCNDKMSGDCYMDIEKAYEFLRSRSDRPEQTEWNQLIWISRETGNNYKIHILTVVK